MLSNMNIRGDKSMCHKTGTHMENQRRIITGIFDSHGVYTLRALRTDESRFLLLGGQGGIVVGIRSY